MNPRATYRLQLHPGFGFAAAAAAVPYRAEVGASHLDLAPILMAAEGSAHGYDVVDPERISDALGGEAGFAALAAAARAAGLGILLDIVPNHMSIAGHGNRWWLDVLENGPASPFAHYFDVDWRGGEADRVLLAVLGERYGQAIASGAIRIEHDAQGRFAVRANGADLPLAPRALGAIVRRAGERIGHAELTFIGETLAALVPEGGAPDERRRRHRALRVLAARLAALVGEPPCAVALGDEVAAVNSDPAKLDAILEMQAYRLAHWTVAGSQLPYRRFFDIATLVAVRMEDPDVFEACHARVLALVTSGAVDGLRVDHVDGLRDPRQYLERLRMRAPNAWIVVEKILTADEVLPHDWPIEGTTGYDFMERLGGLIVDPDGEAALTGGFVRMTGLRWDPHAASREARHAVLAEALHSELARLTELAARACAVTPAMRDYTRGELEAALAEILVGFPVYRSYLRNDRRAEIDRARIAAAVAAARDAKPDLDGPLLAFLGAALALELPAAETRDLALAFQQVTGAVVAKGDEDTLLYRFVRLASRCEVGADLTRFAYEPAHVHRALAAAPPRGLLATSTHDSKRSEDVRARIAVLSEMPARWLASVARWDARAARGWGEVAPDPVLACHVWQTLVGAWPVPVERVRAFAHKAVREARLRTSWRHPDAAYEAALDRWLDGIYGDAELLRELAAFAAELAPHGDRNSLAMLLVKLAAPGVPDFYWGCELRDDSLVDPDNRRDIDLAGRRARLHALSDASAADVVALGDPGAVKLFAIRRVLGLRRRRPALWDAPYRALAAVGPHAHRVFAFARGDRLIAIAPRLGVGADGWSGTTLELPPGAWRDVLADRTWTPGAHPVAALWKTLPIALLANEA